MVRRHPFRDPLPEAQDETMLAVVSELLAEIKSEGQRSDSAQKKGQTRWLAFVAALAGLLMPNN